MSKLKSAALAAALTLAPARPRPSRSSPARRSACMPATSPRTWPRPATSSSTSSASRSLFESDWFVLLGLEGDQIGLLEAGAGGPVRPVPPRLSRPRRLDHLRGAGRRRGPRPRGRRRHPHRGAPARRTLGRAALLGGGAEWAGAGFRDVSGAAGAVRALRSRHLLARHPGLGPGPSTAVCHACQVKPGMRLRAAKLA